MTEKNPYQVLGVAFSATKDEIRKAYRALARKYHPDSNPGNKVAEEKFKEVNDAYVILSDEKKRADFDNQRRNHSSNTTTTDKRTNTTRKNSQRQTYSKKPSFEEQYANVNNMFNNFFKFK